MPGPLVGIRIVEIAGLGAAPFAGMMLADHGAEVIRVERPDAVHQPFDPLLRSRRSITLDLKRADDVETLRALCRSADGLIEGFRPGVMERLGVGPEVLLGDNHRLVYGRMTGWGQSGAWAATAGHDINYIAMAGVLGALGRADDKPTPPINLLGDFGGGGMMLAFAMLAALLAVRAGGSGQVIDCAMTDGASLLMAMIWGFRAKGAWQDAAGTNLLDTGAPFYDCYETADGGFVSLGAIEPQFYAQFRQRAGIAEDPLFDAQHDKAQWPAQKAAFAALFRSRTRQDWCDAMGLADVCCTPVLSMAEAPDHPYNRERGGFLTVGGVMQPAPAPRYSATPCAVPTAPPAPGADTGDILSALASADY